MFNLGAERVQCQVEMDTSLRCTGIKWSTHEQVYRQHSKLSSPLFFHTMAFKQLAASVTAALLIGAVNGIRFLPLGESSILTLSAGAITRRVACPDGVNTATNAACCGLFAVRDDLNKNLFNGGQCNDEAHEALRLTFHDAIAISPALEAQGTFGFVLRPLVRNAWLLNELTVEAALTDRS